MSDVSPPAAEGPVTRAVLEAVLKAELERYATKAELEALGAVMAAHFANAVEVIRAENAKAVEDIKAENARSINSLNKQRLGEFKALNDVDVSIKEKVEAERLSSFKPAPRRIQAGSSRSKPLSRRTPTPSMLTATTRRFTSVRVRRGRKGAHSADGSSYRSESRVGARHVATT
jgi:hypothetical protein